MSDHSHRGAKAAGPLSAPVDRRVLELDEALRGVEAVSGALPGLGFFRDPTRAAAAGLHSLGYPGRVSRGVVVHPLPGVNWYKVQVGDGAGWIAACAGAHGSLMPMGGKDLSMPGPNDNVLVFKPKGLNYGYILCTIPAAVSDGSVSVPDWVVQAGGSGLKREAGHKFPLKGLYKGGGVIDWSAQRPVDQTPLDRGWVSPFGPAVTLDDEMVQARVNEMTGLWMTVCDNWCRLAGGQLLVESFSHEVDAGEDEGESRHFTGIATYPHEALGLFSPIAFTAETPPDQVQYTSHRAAVDLPQGAEDQQPIYRYQEYGGYLGQGHLRLVVKPGGLGGRQRYRTQGRPDTGLFVESIGLDGSVVIASAKDVLIAKRCQVTAPRARTLPTAKAGDDAESGGYKFSSLYGAGQDHRVGDVRVDGTPKSMLKVAAVLDFIAYAVTWKAVHPFHYHAGDYWTPNPSEMELPRNQEPVNFSAESRFFVDDPEPLRLRIDHRYGDVEYFARESFIRMADDGSVHIAAGAGEEVVLAGGRVRINAPLGVDVCPGADFTVQANQVILKARGSVDVSTTEGDVRVKAERNMQFLAGNEGRGGMLFESKGRGTMQQYKDKFGEDVTASGIVFRAAEGVAAVLAKDIYLRTGGADLGEGDILLDASRGKRRVQVFGREFHTYTTRAVTFNYGPVDSSSSVNKVYYFGDRSCVMDAQLLLGGKLIGYSGGGGTPGVIVDGGVYGTKSFATAGVMADKKGMFLGKVPGGFAGIIASAVNLAADAVDELKEIAELRHQTTVVDKYYQQDQMGDDELIGLLKFSFRDPPDSTSQYKTDGFRWPESRWQQFVRLGLGSGGVPWTERPVNYQGRDTYPWPGKRMWAEEPALLGLDGSTMFDPATGRDQDRPGVYENPRVGSLTETVLDGNYTLSRS